MTTQSTSVRLPDDLHAALKARAAAEDRTEAQIIRLALRAYLTPNAGPASTPRTGKPGTSANAWRTRKVQVEPRFRGARTP